MDWVAILSTDFLPYTKNIFENLFFFYQTNKNLKIKIIIKNKEKVLCKKILEKNLKYLIFWLAKNMLYGILLAFPFKEISL